MYNVQGRVPCNATFAGATAGSYGPGACFFFAFACSLADFLPVALVFLAFGSSVVVSAVAFLFFADFFFAEVFAGGFFAFFFFAALFFVDAGFAGFFSASELSPSESSASGKGPP